MYIVLTTPFNVFYNIPKIKTKPRRKTYLVIKTNKDINVPKQEKKKTFRKRTRSINKKTFINVFMTFHMITTLGVQL
jgi:hypothetical protein